MKKILILLISTLAFSNASIKLNTDIDVNTRFTKLNSFKDYANDSNNIYSNIEINYENPYFESISKFNLNNNIRRDRSSLSYMDYFYTQKLGFKALLTKDSSLNYYFDFIVGDSRKLNRKSGNFIQGVGFNTKILSGELSVDHMSDYVNALNLNLNINHKNTTFNSDVKYILRKDLHLIDIYNLNNDMGGHSHDDSSKKDLFNPIPYDIETVENFNRAKLEFKNVSFDNSFEYTNEKDNLEYAFSGKYNLKYVVNSMNEAFNQRIIRNTFEIGANVDYNILDFTIGNELKYELDNVDFTINKIRPATTSPNQYTYSNILSFNTLDNFNRNSLTYENRIAYSKSLYDDKLNIDTGINSTITLSLVKKTTSEEVLKPRKLAYENEVREAKEKEENMSEENKAKLVEYNKQIAAKNEEIKKFDERTDFSDEISKARVDESMKTEFKSVFAGKKASEINDAITKTKNELLNFEKEKNLTYQTARDLFTKIRSQNKEGAKEEYKKILSTESGFDDYYDKKVKYTIYKGFDAINSSLINTRATLTRELNKILRDKKAIDPSVDETIANNYFILEDMKTGQFSIDLDINPYLNLDYNVNENINIYSNNSLNLEFNQKLNKLRGETTSNKVNIPIKYKFEFGINFKF